MIKTIYEIGKILKKDEDYATYFKPWQIPFREGTEAEVLVVNVKNGVIAPQIDVEKYRSAWVDKYLYREATGRATNLVPTFYFYKSNQSDEEKWVVEQEENIKKLIHRIKSCIKNYNHDFTTIEEIDSLETYLLGKSRHLSGEHYYLITFKIDGKYPGEIPEFVELFHQEGNTKYYKKAYGKAVADDHVCALTGEKTQVFGFVDTLGFTVNDKAFNRNGFNTNNAYKMFPVSAKAVSTLEGAMAFAEEKIAQRFYGTNTYLILPQFIGTMSDEAKQEIVELFIEKQAMSLQSKSDKGTGGFINDTEDIILEIVDEEQLSLVNYEMLFYEKNKGQMSLMLQLHDVTPSRLREIVRQKSNKEKYYSIITNVPPKGKKKGYTYSLNLYRIRDFFLTEQGKKKIPHPFFFRLMEAIFCNQTIKKSLVLDFILKNIRKKFKKRHEAEWAFPTAVREGFILLEFLESLHLFNHKKQVDMDTPPQVALNVFDFIEDHPRFFTSEYKKGAFIFGALTARLLYNQPGNAFLKDLNNLVITKEIVNKKFPKLIDKLRKYGSEFRDMESAASQYFLVNDEIGTDEISMAFTTGMILQQNFDQKNKALKDAAKTPETNN